jgi:3-hydroxyacyl-CoA dehydrogenase
MSSQPQDGGLPHSGERVALIGLGAIGISFLALHLSYSSAVVSVYDPRPDLQEHLESVLPLYLPEGAPSVAGLISSNRLKLCSSLESAVRTATVVQEQGPENRAFKQKTWSEVVKHVSPTTHLWSSTSGIPASQQLADLEGESAESARERLLIVHPFNPPHIMPLLELVPSSQTSPAETDFAKHYFTLLRSGHRPIVVHKETAGFVANRLSFILFREACNLVDQGVASVEEVDEIVRASLGPRWAVAGPFKMYGFGGGDKGMRGFLHNIGEAIDGVWKDGSRQVAMTDEPGLWKEKIIAQTDRAYGLPTAQQIRARDRGLRAVVKAQEEQEEQEKQGRP